MLKNFSKILLVVILSAFFVGIIFVNSETEKLITVKTVYAETPSEVLRAEQIKIKSQAEDMYVNMNSYYDRLIAIGSQAGESLGESRSTIAKQFLSSSNLFAQALGKYASLSTESTKQNDESFFKSNAGNYYQLIQKYNKLINDNVTNNKEKISLLKDPETLLFSNFYNKKAEEVLQQIKTQQKAQEASKQVAADSLSGSGKCWDKCIAKTTGSKGEGLAGIYAWLSGPFQKMLCDIQCLIIGLIMDFLRMLEDFLGQVPI